MRRRKDNVGVGQYLLYARGVGYHTEMYIRKAQRRECLLFAQSAKENCGSPDARVVEAVECRDGKFESFDGVVDARGTESDEGSDRES